ncbi:MAG: Ppx/GppA family phosphatase [Polyangiaceae bacterium]|nr:Ppx/GppA family phosphatase [Polyangiaceae bacterium]MCW5789998.1 Ppx/GppA family phosphatase [Polyangiaceae bacterium]
MGASRAAAIDIGTNSVLLTVAERGPAGLAPVLERATITRLGEGVDQRRALSDAAAERTLACLREYAATLRELGSPPLRVVGTSALRDAALGSEFCAAARELLGEAIEIISGEREARLSYRGALSGLTELAELDAACPVLVFDVGGGSTEIIAAQGGTIHWCQSLDVGCVRLTERLLRADPPTPSEIEGARALIRRALAALPAPHGEVALVGVAGTLTTLAAVARGISPYDPERVHGARLTAEEMETLTTRLAALSTAERTALPGLSPKRADVIVAGALIACEVLRWAGAEGCIVSDRGVRWGLLHEQLG